MIFSSIFDIEYKRDIGLWFVGMRWSFLGFGIIIIRACFHIAEKYDHLKHGVNMLASMVEAIFGMCFKALFVIPS